MSWRDVSKPCPGNGDATRSRRRRQFEAHCVGGHRFAAAPRCRRGNAALDWFAAAAARVHRAPPHTARGIEDFNHRLSLRSLLRRQCGVSPEGAAASGPTGSGSGRDTYDRRAARHRRRARCHERWIPAADAVATQSELRHLVRRDDPARTCPPRGDRTDWPPRLVACSPSPFGETSGTSRASKQNLVTCGQSRRRAAPCRLGPRPPRAMGFLLALTIAAQARSANATSASAPPPISG